MPPKHQKRTRHNRMDADKKSKRTTRDKEPYSNKRGGKPEDVKETSFGDGVKSLLRRSPQAFLLIVISLLLLVSLAWIPEGLSVTPPVSVPLDAPKVVDSVWKNEPIYSKRLWGSYRPNVYFGMRPRIPNSLLFGMMWFSYDANGGKSDIRHTCENTDNLQRYSWIRHDGTSFGQQEIVDNYIIMKTDFITNSDNTIGDTWTARIRADSQSPLPVLVSFIFYVYNEGKGDMSFVISTKNRIEGLQGQTPELTNFGMFFKHTNVSKDAVHNHLSAHLPSVIHLTKFMKSVMKVSFTSKKGWPFIAQLPGDIRDSVTPRFGSNLLAYQVTAYLPFEMDLTFKTLGALSISGDRFTTELKSRNSQFDKKFEDTFQLKAKGLSRSQISFAKAAFSSLIGGIGYFYGKSKVISKDLKHPVDYWPGPLYTAVPSRSSFPRGFLWDEGFHQLLIAYWDTSIVKDVIAHWLDLMNQEGWIPREQILGAEARSKVPAEFVVQHNENANPPTFFLTLEQLIKQMQTEDKLDYFFLKRIYPRLKQWFEWFNTTQAGEKPFTYRWRGRNETTDRELNPKTLTSGFDDFPRASHPTSKEYHVDLRCWMTLASGVMAKIAYLLQEDSTAYKLTHDNLFDQTLLDQLHWNTKKKMYSDYGLHTSKVKLTPFDHPNSNVPSYKRREVSKDPSLRFVGNFGYVNLFPFFLKQVSPSSDKLNFILDRLSNESLLWSEYGLRSLSKIDACYNKYNTEHDPPYWRGAIWINMNYLACRALHHYGNVEGPYRQKAEKLYEQLRSNLIENVYTQFLRTGYIWEQYDDDIGSGKGTRSFTGWSSLIVLIMAEKY